MDATTLRTSHGYGGSLKAGAIKRSHVFYGAPIKVASEEQMHVGYSMMMYMMGTMARVVCTRVRAFQEDISTHKDLYRQSLKSNTVKAVASCDRLMKAFLHLADIDNLREAWLNITEDLERKLELDMMKLYFSLDNEVSRGKCEPHTVITNFAIAHKLSYTLNETAKAFGRFLHEEIGMGGDVELSQKLTIPIKGIYGYLTSVATELIDNDTMNVAFDALPVVSGFKIVINKILDWNHISKSCRTESAKARVNSPEYGENGEDVETFDNRGAAWNDVQDRIIVLGYGKLSDDDLAEQLGRTKAAIRARARKLGVRKTKVSNRKTKTK